MSTKITNSLTPPQRPNRALRSEENKSLKKNLFFSDSEFLSFPPKKLDEKKRKIDFSQCSLPGPGKKIKSVEKLANLPKPFASLSDDISSGLPKPFMSSSDDNINISLLPRPSQEAFDEESSFTPNKDQLKEMKRKQAPPSILKRDATTYMATYKGYNLKHFTDPSIIKTHRLISLDGDGQYKTAWQVPSTSPQLVPGISNDDILVLTFKDNKYNSNVRKTYEHMKNAIDQYKQIEAKFGADRCGIIYNANTAMQDGYFIVKKIDLSLEDILDKKLNGKFKRFENITQLNQPLDDNQRQAINILKQIKEFYDLSIRHEIDTDIHKGNFRVVKDSKGLYKLLLTDFRESIDEDEDELIINKITEFRNLKNDLSKIFSKKFMDAYFADTIEKFQR